MPTIVDLFSSRAVSRALAMAACLLALCLHGCFDLSDCKLYNTCSGDLIKLATEKMSPEAAEECSQCLKDSCQDQADTCSVNVECNYTARCRLTTTPVDYQTCLTELREQGFSKGDEERKPWEGEPINAFADCLHGTRCKSHCDQERFACGDVSAGSYRRLKVQLAVRMFSDLPTFGEPSRFTVVKDAQARVCSSTCEDEWGKADANGLIELTVENIEAASLYFELKPLDGGSDFPLTLYYPRRLGESGLQLIAVYLVRKGDIVNGNTILGFGQGAELLADAGQSFILPDGCIWEDNSVPRMRLSVENRAVPQCHQLPMPCSDGKCEACIWYASTRNPSRTKEHTDGTGAGIVGLPEGEYDVRAEDDEGHVSSRTIRMVPGAMTIARTWPATP